MPTTASQIAEPRSNTSKSNNNNNSNKIVIIVIIVILGIIGIIVRSQGYILGLYRIMEQKMETSIL